MEINIIKLRTEFEKKLLFFTKFYLIMQYSVYSSEDDPFSFDNLSESTLLALIICVTSLLSVTVSALARQLFGGGHLAGQLGGLIFRPPK
ncbi:hypothetical protein BpHYR1_050886 [Brachionus plicatilis]|uniref:Uncharacterized protein n=1 Tax=Brachionus plicatilis TaxID=10195 RepID=A0A3M7RXL0_BRAPC|nr:hypothetical protein BpHYR1_050886 [Brachionus plicatilis]